MQLSFFQIVLLIVLVHLLFTIAPAPVNTMSLPQYPCNPYCFAVRGSNSSQ